DDWQATLLARTLLKGGLECVGQPPASHCRCCSPWPSAARGRRPAQLARPSPRCRNWPPDFTCSTLRTSPPAAKDLRTGNHSIPTPMMPTLPWERPTTLSEASRAVRGSSFGSEESTATKRSGCSSLEKQLKTDGTCSPLPRSCWHWRLAEKNKSAWRRNCSAN